MLSKFSLSHTYPVGIERLWTELVSFSTPEHRYFGYGVYRLSRLPMGQAQEGQQHRADVRLFGLIPIFIFIKTKIVRRDDQAKILDSEDFNFFPLGLWEHSRRLLSLTPTSTAFNDEVSIAMGPWSFVVAMFAKSIIRGRHSRMLRRLARSA